ncbi:MAG: hypothetical protein JWO52_6699 [Gammaproteobacteria bacterium]|nr:hypothetical protein [Gammaproteobacteria bacterium]
MLSNPLQYSPQSLGFPFPQFGHDSGQGGVGQFAANPYLQSQWQSPVGHNPFLGPFAGHGGASIPAHQLVPVLAQLAQQIAVQGAVAQQTAIAVHQLAQQLASQAAGHPGSGFGAGQGFGGGGQQYFGGAAQPPGVGQPFGVGQPGMGQPFGFGGQSGYGGLNPQAQGWGQPWGGRSQTIQ